MPPISASADVPYCSSTIVRACGLRFQESQLDFRFLLWVTPFPPSKKINPTPVTSVYCAFNPFIPKRSPIDKLNCLVLARVKSLRASGHLRELKGWSSEIWHRPHHNFKKGTPMCYICFGSKSQWASHFIWISQQTQWWCKPLLFYHLRWEIGKQTSHVNQE